MVFNLHWRRPGDETIYRLACVISKMVRAARPMAPYGQGLYGRCEDRGNAQEPQM